MVLTFCGSEDFAERSVYLKCVLVRAADAGKSGTNLCSVFGMSYGVAHAVFGAVSRQMSSPV
jgi:hypothetical protein